MFPSVLILVVLDFVVLIVAGILSNTLAEHASSAANLIWWLWLLLVIGSVIFIGWRLQGPFYLRVGQDGIEYHHNRLRAAFKWSEIWSFTIAPRDHLFGNRPTLCLRLANDLGPEILFAQRLSRSNNTPPFRETSTGWIVLCYLNQFTLPAADIDAAITHFAGPDKRIDR
jgi:hypothetical protein